MNIIFLLIQPSFFQDGVRFHELYDQLLSVSPFGNMSSVYAEQGYDATWTFARALNKTLTGKILILDLKVSFILYSIKIFQRVM